MVANNYVTGIRYLLHRSPALDINRPNKESQQTALHLAALNANPECMKLLLECDGIDINCTDRYKRTPLNLAAKKGHHQHLVMLLNRSDIDVNAADHEGMTSVHTAAVSGHTKCLAALMRSRFGAKLNILNKEGLDPVGAAARVNQLPCVQLLLTSENVKHYPLEKGRKNIWFQALESGHTECFSYLLTLPHFPINKVVDGSALIHLAAKSGNAGALKLLLAHHDIDVNVPDERLKTPLEHAVRGGYLECVKMLLEKPRTVLTGKLLRSAKKRGHFEILRLLYGDTRIPATDLLSFRMPANAENMAT